MTEIGYIDGLYAMWDELRSRHPGLLIDNCASGGRRIDLETCSRSIPLWQSDLQCHGPSPAATQAQNAGLWRWIPMHACANFGYEPSYISRSAMTSGNILVAGDAKLGRVSTHLPETLEAVTRTVAACKKLRPFLLGDFYPLLPHNEAQDQWFGYQFHRADMNSGVLLLFRREKCPDATTEVTLYDVDPSHQYRALLDVDGAQSSQLIRLARLKVKIPSAPGACLVYYQP
jgi:alpha-galactosidase